LKLTLRRLIIKTTINANKINKLEATF